MTEERDARAAHAKNDDEEREEATNEAPRKRPHRTGGQAEGEPSVHEEDEAETPLERKRPSQAEG